MLTRQPMTFDYRQLGRTYWVLEDLPLTRAWIRGENGRRVGDGTISFVNTQANSKELVMGCRAAIRRAAVISAGAAAGFCPGLSIAILEAGVCYNWLPLLAPPMPRTISLPAPVPLPTV
jgi:hypothetical protein